MKYLLVFAMLVASSIASAAGLPCSIHPDKSTPAPSLQSLARVSLEQARAIAVSVIGIQAAVVAEGELEVERGCLVYSFDIRVPDRRGVEELMVDAGDGKVLSHKHESPQQEAAEQAKDGAGRGNHPLQR